MPVHELQQAVGPIREGGGRKWGVTPWGVDSNQYLYRLKIKDSRLIIQAGDAEAFKKLREILTNLGDQLPCFKNCKRQSCRYKDSKTGKIELSTVRFLNAVAWLCSRLQALFPSHAPLWTTMTPTNSETTPKKSQAELRTANDGDTNGWMLMRVGREKAKYTRDIFETRKLALEIRQNFSNDWFESTMGGNPRQVPQTRVARINRINCGPQARMCDLERLGYRDRQCARLWKVYHYVFATREACMQSTLNSPKFRLMDRFGGPR
ncbi:hypothetical protein B0H12DRAFT_1070478 [Mycena haematopus]|nr:hypothetical protein B0H12DRAFT_1070478 [Mycena haematopus]